MSERDELATLIDDHAYGPDGLALSAADAILASDWLAAHDESVRAEALAPFIVLAHAWESSPADCGSCSQRTAHAAQVRAILGCDCHRHEMQVCDICQGVTGSEVDQDAKPVLADPSGALAAHDKAVAAKALTEAAAALDDLATEAERAASPGYIDQTTRMRAVWLEERAARIARTGGGDQ